MKIKKLTIFSASLVQQFYFYCNRLSFSSIEKTAGSFTIQTGNSLLEIVKTELSLTSKYHLAFNIEPSLINATVDYLKERNIILFEDNRQSLINFPDWNARSVYFEDADGNVLEFIARYNLSDEKYNRPFSPNDVFSLSEVGVPVDDTAAFISTLNQHTDAAIWKVYGPDFVPVGDEEGLLIVVRQPRNWFPTQVSATQLPMELIIDQPGKDFEYGPVKFYFA